MSISVKKFLLLGLAGTLMGFFSGDNLWTRLVEGNLYKAIRQEARVAEEVRLKLAPMGFLDLLRGKIRGFDFSAARLSFEDGPVFEDLRLTSKGIDLNPGSLWFEKKLEIKKLAETHLSLRLSEEEITAAMRRDLPDWEPYLRLQPEGIILEGSLKLLGGGKLPFKATALLERASGTSLRLTPTGLDLAGISLFPGVFRSYQKELTWEYPLEIPWPLQMTEFKLEDGYLQIKWREKNEETEE